MGQYDFTYEFPKGFSKNAVQTLEEKSCGQLANAFQNCTFEYNDLGLAYYNGFGGNQDVWNKHAMDLSFDGNEKKHKYLEKLRDDTLEIDLPKETGDTFEVLSQDIYYALAKDEPTLVLDRLHTYASKFIREICSSYNKAGILVHPTKHIPLMRLTNFSIKTVFSAKIAGSMKTTLNRGLLLPFHLNINTTGKIYVNVR